MNTLVIKIPTFYGGRTLNLAAPDEFNKLSAKQIIALTDLIFSDRDMITKKTMATKILYGIKWYQWLWFTPAQRAYLNTFCTWVFDGDHWPTDNKLLKLRTDMFSKPLYGPLGGFETLSAEEWTSADMAYTSFIETSEMEHLDNMIAILWRPRDKKTNENAADFKNDYRIPFNTHTVDRRVKTISKLPLKVKLAVLLWYKGCRQEWETIFDKVFSGGTQEAVENYGWLETIQKVSGTKFGSHNETSQTYMYKILLNMQIEIKDHEYWKSKNKTSDA